MSQRVVVLLVAGAALAGVLLWYSGLLDEPEDQWYRDLRRAHWIWWGAEAPVLDETLRRISQASGERLDQRHDTIAAYGPGHWTFEFAALGAARLAEAESTDDAERARQLYHQASVYYGLAKYPGYGVDANEVAAHRAQLQAYEASQQLNPLVSFSTLEVPVPGGVIRGYLHLPANRDGAVPLVIGTNGIDVFKAEFGPIVDALISEGFGFFAFDMPSTGEAAEFPLRPGIDQIYLEVMRSLQRRPDIDESRVALWGVSFGGNPVVRAAHRAPKGLQAVVNWCGPVHEVFQISEFELGLVEDMYLDALKYRTHLPDASPAELLQAMDGFSLVDAGLIRPGEVTTSVPILSVNAKGDYVAPETDLELVTQSSQQGVLFYSGSDDHCPQDRYSATAQTVEWLVRHL